MDGNANFGGRQSARQLSHGEVNGYLRNLLRGYNDRDVEAIGRHIKTLRDALERYGDDVIPTRFGGSVSKHTYVQGLSDVDALFIVNESSLSGQSPEHAIDYMAKLFRQRLPRTKMDTGDLAVTVTFSDEIEIQVLPAIRTKSGFRIADPERDGWSNVVHPERFAQKLTEVNQANNRLVIPTIKLAKALANRVIRNKREKISGYHMESLAIEVFHNCRGPHDLASMLSHFCTAAATAVLHPITDSTGQSRDVDEYLGQARSRARRRAAEHFKEMGRRFEACHSVEDLDDLFRESNGSNGGGARTSKGPGGGPSSLGVTRSLGAGTPVSAFPATRTFPPRSPYAVAGARSLAVFGKRREEHNLTPLSAANISWLFVNQPRMRYDGRSGVISGTFSLCASWDPATGLLTTNPWHPANPVIADDYELQIRLRYSTRYAGLPSRYPPVYETGDRTLRMAVERGLPLADLHMYPNGECCLGFSVVVPCRDDFDLAKFFEEDITPWLYRLAYVERFGLERARRELWPEYDHWGGPRQHLAMLRGIAESLVPDNGECPCGNGLPYDRCHQPEIEQCRIDGLM